MTLFVISVVAALSISAICSVLEAALLSLSSSQVEALAVRRPRIGGIWRRFKNEIEKPIAVILIVNTAAHTIGATVAGAQFETVFGRQWLVLFSIIFTFLMLQFTEILPKTLGVRYNVRLAPLVATPLSLIVRALTPVLWFVHLINRPFERGSEPQDSTVQEITALASMARVARRIDPRQERMIRAATRMDELRVRQIMTPRHEVICIRLQDEVQAILDIVQDGKFTRFPLCDGDLEHVVGLVHIKDLFKHLKLVPGRFDITPIDNSQGIGPERVLAVPGSGLHVIGSAVLDLRTISREIHFVPETLAVLTLLRQFQESRQHFAVVVDEHGSTTGVVTLEDVFEEMIGEIEDEFDMLGPPMVIQQGKDYIVSARMPAHDFLHRFALLDLEDESVDTVGGLVSKAFGRIPNVGEDIRLGRYVIRVTQADNRAVRELRVRAAGHDAADHTT